MNNRNQKELEQRLSTLFANENVTWDSSYLQSFPKRYIRHGDMLVLSTSTLAKDCWKNVDKEKLMRCIADAFKVKRIAIQGNIHPDGIRTPTVEMVLGDSSLATHIDNKIRYTFDIRKCMFSSGNITEKIRMSKLDCENEIVTDMFAGIGYFTLPLLVHAGAKLVHACEWNPDAVESLEYNLLDNKVADRCIVHKGDNRKVTPVGVADRVVLGLIPSAVESYEAACKALNPATGGVMHIHENVSSKSKSDTNEDKLLESKYYSELPSCNRKLNSDWLKWAINTAESIENIMLNVAFGSSFNRGSYSSRVSIVHIERVKSYAPHIDHLVLDLKYSPLPKFS